MKEISQEVCEHFGKSLIGVPSLQHIWKLTRTPLS